MNTRVTTSGQKTRQMAMLAMLSAVIIVLQALSSIIRFGPFVLSSVPKW